MKTEKEINEDILNLTMKIAKSYPELSKYVEEMPVTLPDDKHPDVNRKILSDYYDSLKGILDKYILDHEVIEQEKNK